VSELLWHTDAMRTTLDIDDDLLRALLVRHPGATKREAVERAIAEYLSKDAAARTKELRGRVRIEDASSELRAIDRRP
jgi:Arc/MetJ family transcription regulator